MKATTESSRFHPHTPPVPGRLRSVPVAPVHLLPLLAFLVGALCMLAAPAKASTDWQSKVSRAVLDRRPGEERSFLVFLSEQADLSTGRRDAVAGPAGSPSTKEERGRFAFEALRDVQRRTQNGIVRELRATRTPFRTFWITNAILVRGDADLVERLARRSDVDYIFDNSPITGPNPTREAALRAAEWNVVKVRADRVWSDFGVFGDGAVVGLIDSGVEWNHPALMEQYRGWNGATVDHNYNWHDALTTGADSPCGVNLSAPCDSWGHGTGVVGVMTGDDGTGNQIGVAPGARWIACRAFSTGGALGDVSTVLECLEWMLAPTDLAGMNPDPTKAPHVINNSWGCGPANGCTDPLVLLPAIQNLRAAGIVVVHSAGNTGPSCDTIIDPPKIYDEVITVGGTVELGGAIYGPSSRGPAAVTDLLKPDVVAPAAEIRTSFPGATYVSWSGTSFAAPHVAGEVALLVSGFPELAGDVDAIEELVFHNAKPKTTLTENCGGVPGTEVPNNTFGWGRINCLQSHQAALNAVSVPLATSSRTLELLASAPNPSPGRTAIRFELHGSADIYLAIYDTAGRRVRILQDAPVGPGRHWIPWDGRDDRGRPVASGAYFYRLTAGGGEQAVNRLIILR